MRWRIESRVETTNRHHKIFLRSPAQAQNHIALQTKSQHFRVEQAGIKAEHALIKINHAKEGNLNLD